MFNALFTLFSGVVGWLVSLLPAGVDLGNEADSIIREAVAFIKSLDPILATNYTFSCFLIVIGYEVFKMGFDSSSWLYSKIRRG